jgi:hypothetical protein
MIAMGQVLVKLSALNVGELVKISSLQGQKFAINVMGQALYKKLVLFVKVQG